MGLAAWQWAAVAVGAFLIGMSKTGFTSLIVFAVALFALVMPAKQSVGVVLPVMMVVDAFAVLAYRHDAVWSHLWVLFPWTALGVIFGYFALGRVDDQQMSRLIGAILILLVAVQYWRSRVAKNGEGIPHQAWLVALVGVTVGFTAMAANAGGPVMVLYLLVMELPKISFVGTSVWFFMLLNWFKLPFSFQLGLVNPESLRLDAVLAPLALVGAWTGQKLIFRIDQRVFENFTMALTFLAALRLALS